jgi:hypothetical protein
MMEHPKYHYFMSDVKDITSGGTIQLLECVNAWVVENTGNDSVKVEGKTLLPSPGAGLSGQSFGFSGNQYEIYNKNQITITFAGVGANPAVQLVQKYYVAK